MAWDFSDTWVMIDAMGMVFKFSSFIKEYFSEMTMKADRETLETLTWRWVKTNLYIEKEQENTLTVIASNVRNKDVVSIVTIKFCSILKTFKSIFRFKKYKYWSAFSPSSAKYHLCFDTVTMRYALQHRRRYHRHYRHRSVKAFCSRDTRFAYQSAGFSPLYVSRLLRAGAQASELKGRCARRTVTGIMLLAWICMPQDECT